MPIVTARDLTYGIEIECGVNYDCGVRRGGYHSGLPCTALPAFEGRNWRADSDGSLSFRDLMPTEFVSPVLRGKEGLDNIRATCAQIKAWGGAVNNSCGLHIHVAFPSDSVEHMRRLTMLVGQFEDALYAMTGCTSRRSGGYCRPIKTDRAKAFDWSRCRSKDDLAYSGCFSERYSILNWTNFLSGRFNAVEFRVFSGSLNPAKIAAWVQMCLTLVEIALDDNYRIGRDAWDVRVSSMDSFGTTAGEQSARYMCRRLWFGHGLRARNYGELGHERFTRKQAERTLKALAIRHDERAGLRAASTRSAAAAE